MIPILCFFGLHRRLNRRDGIGLYRCCSRCKSIWRPRFDADGLHIVAWERIPRVTR